MKAITVRQPWASLIAAGVKTIETRPRPTSYRGRIAIHAAKGEPSPRSSDRQIGNWYAFYLGHGKFGAHGENPGEAMPLPLGAVVASAVLIDCVPTADLYWTELWKGWAWQSAEGSCIRANPGHTPYPVVVNQSERSFGDFSPGRWALLLDDIAPTTDRCPWCWGAVGATEQDSTPPRLADCSVCQGAQKVDPVPARGQQAVPWEWAP